MISKQLEICIIDDQLPFQKFLNKIDEKKLIPSSVIQSVINSNADWYDEPDLKRLTKDIYKSKYFKLNDINISWALHPNILINSINLGIYKPKLIIYDWEYKGSQSLSEDMLFDLIKLLPKSFFFVYSNLAQKIPILLFKKKLDKYAKRFQLIPKGDHKFILSSEQLILEYIAFLLDKNPIIKIGKANVQFTKSGNLKDYRDILHLEYILGKEFLKSELEKYDNHLSDEIIIKVLSDFDSEFNYKLFLSNNKSLLLSVTNNFYKKKFGPLIEISYSDVFKNYGLNALNSVLNNESYKLVH